MKKIIVITYGYPIVGNPSKYQFVKELVTNWRKQGLYVKVINPLTFSDWIKNRKCKSEDEVFPLYFRFAFLKIFPFLRILQNRIQDICFRKAVEKNIHDYTNTVLYSHFMCAGIVAAKIAKKHGVRSFCAFGESTLWFMKDRNPEKTNRDIRALNGIITVSSQNTRIVRENRWNDCVLEAPNALDIDSFKLLDRNECRKELGFPIDKVIGVFVGHFIERKGPMRVKEAAHGIKDLKMIYIGEGEQKPEDDNILFIGRVDHYVLNKYLCAATEAEGCCNAIVEALGCGIPVISSNGEFNDCILNERNSIRVDYDDIEGIRNAIMILVNDEHKRKEMETYIRSCREQYSLDNRARKIAEFIGASN